MFILWIWGIFIVFCLSVCLQNFNKKITTKKYMFNKITTTKSYTATTKKNKKEERLLNKELYIQSLIRQYSPKQVTRLDELRALDKKVKYPARIFAYVFGSLSSLVLGIGMCLAMNIIGNTTTYMILGIVVGVVGILLMSFTYKIYLNLLEQRKAKYADQILQKSNELLNKN